MNAAENDVFLAYAVSHFNAEYQLFYRPISLSVHSITIFQDF